MPQNLARVTAAVFPVGVYCVAYFNYLLGIMLQALFYYGLMDFQWKSSQFRICVSLLLLSLKSR